MLNSICFHHSSHLSNSLAAGIQAGQVLEGVDIKQSLLRGFCRLYKLQGQDGIMTWLAQVTASGAHVAIFT